MPSSRDRGGRSSQKALQLCAQVRDALSYALGESSDPVLLDLSVEFVEVMSSGQLLVGVLDFHGHGLLATLDALDRASGFLRTSVAEQVHRSKAPRLSFTVVPPGDER